jgi:hypothetical protein
MNSRPNIVLVHGAWADGSSWSAVIERPQADGYHSRAGYELDRLTRHGMTIPPIWKDKR